MRYEAALFSSSVRFSGLFGGAGVAGGGVGGRVVVEQWILTWHLSLFVPVGLTIFEELRGVSGITARDVTMAKLIRHSIPKGAIDEFIKPPTPPPFPHFPRFFSFSSGF